jgi:hypothetical protein
MKTNSISSSNGFKGQFDLKGLPNPEMLSRQIESLRVVLRRMKANESSKLDSLINQKLKELE